MFNPRNIWRSSVSRRRLVIGINVLFFICIASVAAAAQNVNVTATAGTAAASYTTLKGAFDAVNAGTHQGAITMDIAASTSEGATPAVLNSSGAGAASYTSVLIRPSVDGVTVAGASPTGRGVIELNGADNVTINGDNPNTAGTNRNLTIQNTATATTAFTSVIRIALAATVVTSADNDSFRNLNLIGNATGRNVAGATSTTGSENTVYGVLATGGASTTTATAAPAAIASVTTTIGTGATASNLLVDNNSVATVARGIAVQGSATTVFPGLTISNNLIGNATASAVDQVYSVGITAQGSANGSIAGNTVYIESFLPSSTSSANRAIDVGGISATGTFTIERNRVNRAKNNAPDFWLAHGINLGGGNNHVVRNNFIINITLNTTSGGFYSTTFAAVGIRVASGTGHQIYHNSVNLTGAIPGATDTITAACMITATALTGVDVRNNIFANSLTGGSAASAHVSLFLPSGGTSTMNLTLNNNDYFEGPNATNGIAQVGTTPGTGFFKAANFNAATTTPATNLRSYTSTLNAAGTNDNASKVVDPQFISATDLHIAPASPMVDMGANVGVGTDIDGQARVGTPDIGADEPGGVTPAANDIAAVAIINPPPGSTRSTTTVITPQASFTNNGTAAQTNVPVRFRILDSTSAIVYDQTASIPSINPGQTLTVSFPNVTLSTPGTYTTTAIAELPGDQNTANDSVSGTVNIIAPLAAGTYTVGAGGNFASLTNTGGIFEALNAAGASGNVVINITSDLTGESGSVPLNEVAGGFSVTIKPSGAARTITGTAANLSLIKLNGADNVTIDGSLSGGTDRSLTMTYGNTGGTVIWIASVSAANGANGNTVKNCILSGNTGATIISGVLAGSGTTFGGDAETANSNNTIQNNAIFRVQNAAFLRGSGTAFDQNWLITGNTFGTSVAADKLLFRGMLIGNAQNFTVSNNVINGISSTTTTSSTMSGIQVALLVNGGSITGNRMSDIKQNNTAGWGSNGIFLTSTSTASNLTVANNFISDVASQGFNGMAETDNGYGIAAVAGGGYKIYHNSVNLNTNQGANAAAGITAAVNITAGVTTAGAIDLRDNVLANTQTVGTRYAVISGAPATVFSNINYNDYFAQNVGFLGSARPTLPNWQTATGQDANSLAVNPLFVASAAPADLHLQPSSPVINAGTPVGVTTDIDGQTRDAMPDMGADEIVTVVTPGMIQFSAPTYSVAENVAGGMATITATRAGDVSGAASATYATANGTANGGAACGPNVDYVATTGTLNFAAGETSKTFNVTICDESVFENDETVFLSLTNVTGATAGSPTNAVLTITNDDAAPAPPIARDVLISEFRFRGPTFSAPQGIDGALDEYVELYNNTDSAITVGATDGAGWTLAALASDGTTITPLVTIPNGTIIPARAHYLAVNSDESTTRPGDEVRPNGITPAGGYSLNSYAVGDDFYTTDVPDNSGVALFRTATPANYTLANRLDAVGFNSFVGATADLFREGTPLPAPSPFTDGQYAYVRTQTTGTPKDTDSNASDFAYVSTNGGIYGGIQSQLGAPGPENCGCRQSNLFFGSPIQRNATIKSSLIDPTQASTAPPNRIRDTTPGTGATAFGTLDLRRKFTNTTGQMITRLRFRVVDITTLNSPNPVGSQADLRVLTSADTTANGGTITILGSTVEAPANGTVAGGGTGLNSSLVVAIPSGTLAPGASVNVRFLLGVATGGSFRFFINVEALSNNGTIQPPARRGLNKAIEGPIGTR